VADHHAAVLGAAEGTGAEIAWVVIYVLCWILMIAPFALWWAGVRTPRSERRGRATPPAAGHSDHPSAAQTIDDAPARAAG
jgi:hypothetical protein